MRNSSNSNRVSGRRSKSLGKEINEDLIFFKTTVVNDQNIETIKLKLKSTAAKRLQLSKNKKFDFLENFPFFFTNPQLVRMIKHNLNEETKFDL